MAKFDSLNDNDVVFIDGTRTPFQKSGTGYKNLMAYDLARHSISALVARTGIDPASPDRVVMGNVIQEVRTTNVAREAALGAGIPNSVPANTVTMACISANAAIAQCADMIRAGSGSLAIAGGTETMSDVPIRLSKRLRRKLLESQKYRSPLEYFKLLKGFRFKDLAPELPAIAEFSTGDTMGKSCDKLAAMFSVSREAQDKFALDSHHKAAKAHESGFLKDEVTPVPADQGKPPVMDDNGVRGDSKMEKISKLRPAFLKPHGTVTAANASFLTDGASAVLLAGAAKAKKENLPAKALIKDYLFVSQDPQFELLLGPAYAIPKILERNGLTISDIDVLEIHEAFAGQVLANLEALSSKKFLTEDAGVKLAPFSIPEAKLNAWGGSLSIGHPFGATGGRLVTTAVNRLHHENGKFAVVAACAAGGQGHAMLIERINA